MPSASCTGWWLLLLTPSAAGGVVSPRRARSAPVGGAAPIPASSGQRVRVRLNRSGDRQLNQALHLIVLTRLRYDPATRAYAQRRPAEGKTNREIRRSLVRYVARQLYRLLEAQPKLDQHRSVHGNDRRLLQVRRILRVSQDGRILDRSHTRGLSGISRSNTPGLDRRSAANRSPSATPR
jgi:Transposase IS116/IS110/IS902 family